MTDVTPVVPEGKDPVQNLTVRELDLVSQRLKMDVSEALAGKDGKRWTALAHVAWCWAKRTDATAKLDPFFDYEPDDLAALLRLDEDDEDQEQDPTPGSTEPGPASA